LDTGEESDRPIWVKFIKEKYQILSEAPKLHTEKIRNTTRGCRLWEVKNSGCENSSPTEVKRTFNHQNLSIFITKSMRNFCKTKSSPQNQRTYIKALELFISNLCSFHFPFVAIILLLWLMKFSMPEKWTYLTR
jgi:hypothetical protein